MIESTQVYTHNPYPSFPQQTTTTTYATSPMPQVVITQTVSSNATRELLQHKRCLFGVNLAWMWIIWFFLMIIAGLAVGAGGISSTNYNYSYYSSYYYYRIYVYTPSWVSLGASIYVAAALLLLWIITYTAYGGCLLCGCCCCNDVTRES